MTLSLSFILTLLIFSYLLADNLLYRLAISVFVGIVAAVTTVVTVRSVLAPLVDGTLASSLVLVPAAIFGALLLLKPFSGFRLITNLALAYLIAVGAAIATAGAISGTLIPIARDVVTLEGSLIEIANGIVLFVGAVSALLYFRYATQKTPDGENQRGGVMRLISAVGKGFIVITLGAIYGTTILTSLTVLSGHLTDLFSN